MKLGKLHIRRHHVPHICAGLFALVLLLGTSGPFFVTSQADAALLELRSLEMSDATVSATNVSYKFGFTNSSGGAIGSIKFTICSNYLYEPTDPCTPPPGFDGSSVTLTDQTGITDFSLDPSSTNNIFVLSRPFATAYTAMPLTYEFSGLTNPSVIGSIYVRIATYPTTDASGFETDYGNVLSATSENIEITTEVPPYLLFCTGITIQGYNCGTVEGSAINFGELSINTTRSATSQMLASTNAPYGYSITLAGTTMMAGSNVIPAMDAAATSSVGVSQFGLNARLNTAPSVGGDPDGPGLTMPDNGYEVPNQFKFKSGDIIASSSTTDDYRKMTISYIVNRDRNQAPGRYVATISYICLANF
jgi:hypothetical protein